MKQSLSFARAAAAVTAAITILGLMLSGIGCHSSKDADTQTQAVQATNPPPPMRNMSPDEQVKRRTQQMQQQNGGGR